MGTQKINYPEQVNGAIGGGGNLLGVMGWNNGTPLGTGTVLNFVGSGVTFTLSGTVLNANIPSASNPPVTGSVVIQDEGTIQGSATTLNFVGANVQATVAGGVATVMVTGSSSGGGYSEGTSFPISPSTNDKFYRTDRNYLYYYDGTRWLTVNEFSQTLGNLDVNQPITVNGSLAWGVTDLGNNGQWITRISVVNYVATTNTGSDFWTGQLASRSPTAVAHNIGSTWDTSADTHDQFTKHTVTIGAAVTSGDTHFVITGTKTGSPGSIYTMATVYYRLIG